MYILADRKILGTGVAASATRMSSYRTVQHIPKCAAGLARPLAVSSTSNTATRVSRASSTSETDWIVRATEERASLSYQRICRSQGRVPGRIQRSDWLDRAESGDMGGRDRNRDRICADA